MAQPIVQRFEGNPILTPADVPYTIETVHNAGMAKHNGKYMMLFRAHKATGRSILGLAESDDGYHFKARSEPFMVPTTEGLFAEYEDHDSTINPFAGSRLGASYTHRFESGAETSLHARWTDISHGEPNKRDVSLLTLEGRHRHPITPDLTVEGSVLYRDGEDSLSRDTEGVEVSLSLEWVIRETKIRMRLEHSEFEDEYTSNDSSAVFVHVRRGF